MKVKLRNAARRGCQLACFSPGQPTANSCSGREVAALVLVIHNLLIISFFAPEIKLNCKYPSSCLSRPLKNGEYYGGYQLIPPFKSFLPRRFASYSYKTELERLAWPSGT